VTYIRTTPEQLWAALTTPEFMKKYWFGMNIESDWKTGSPWKLVFPDGRVADIGEIVEIEEPKRLILRWRNQFRPDLHEEGYTRCTMDIGQEGEVVRLTITHEIDKPDSKLIGAVSIAGQKSCRASRHCSKPARRCRQSGNCRAAEHNAMSHRACDDNGCTAVVGASGRASLS
jgi:uncharacterized protein YndB with AHSA1/START domain